MLKEGDKAVVKSGKYEGQTVEVIGVRGEYTLVEVETCNKGKAPLELPNSQLEKVK